MAITISDTEPRIQYTATAGQVSFSVPFEFFDNADLVVIKTDNNVDTTLSYNSSPSTALQYSVSGAGQTGGGSISFGGSGATLNDKITIYRNLAIARSTDFPTSGAFQVESLNTELDKIIAMIQQNERDLKFSPKALATTSNTYNLTFPNLEANKVLTVNSSGDGLVFSADIGSYEGNWATATGYNLRDIVKQSSGSDSTTLNNIYICNTAHTSTGSYLTENDTSNWTLLINVADAANAVVDAEAAQTAAEAAQAAAETAQTAAELAETNAETAETNAETAETNAAASEAAAAASEANAATSESNAATSESNAATSESNASTSASTATTQAGIATTQAGNASTSASNASTSETNAATSESNAATSASNASTSASNASTSETNASNSASAAAASAASAASLLDNFDDVYLGAKAGDPTLDNDGDALNAGDLYYNTSSGNLKYYTGSVWVAITSGGITDVVQDGTPQLGGNLDVNGNSIVSVSNGNINITPNGAGKVVLDAISYPDTDGTAGQALVTNGSGVLSFATTGLAWQPVENSSFFALSAEGYFVDTSSNVVTATLPASPTANDIIRFIDYSGTFDTNNFTVSRNGKKIQGLDSDLIVSTDRSAFGLIFSGDTQGWLLIDK